jgi:hypothetical protein
MDSELTHRRVAMWVPTAGAIAMVLCPWILFALKRLAGFDWLFKPNEDPAGKVYLGVAIGATLIVPPIAWMLVKKNLYLLEHGIKAQARIASSGLWGSGIKVGSSHSVPVTFAYTVDGKEYSIRKDVLKSTASTYGESTLVEVRYDPKNPARCIVLD